MQPPLPDPIAYFITWNTYGTWLPGDSRGWVEYHSGWKLPDPQLELESRAIMAEDACRLHLPQRRLVEATIQEHCQIRNWELFAANCRSNHAHVVVAAPVHPKQVRSQFKAWCTRRLKEQFQQGGETDVRENWWAERGSIRYINDDDSLERSVIYTKDAQDRKGRD